MISYILAGLLIVLFSIVLIAAASGRVRIRSCCAVTDPSKDLRMRAAFIDELD